MAVGLTSPGTLLAVDGIKLGTAAAGIRYSDRDDLAVIECNPGTTMAAVFTQNRFCAAPVVVARDHIAKTAPLALIINSGNANAGTGESGHQAAINTCQQLASALSIETEQVLPFSTGVIGEALAIDKISSAIPECCNNLAADHWLKAAEAIVTTDTVAKAVSTRCDVAGTAVTITGIAKGSGMIRPDMATMLGFIATDASITQSMLDQALRQTLANSFNRISVDGDTSTNDACILMASGCADMEVIDSVDQRSYQIFVDALQPVMTELAQAIVRDGEGITKFVEINVSGGSTEEDCAEVAYTLAHSPLVKTALFASDPNWGRLLAAVGRAKVGSMQLDQVSISINQCLIVEQGAVARSYTEQAGQAAIDPDELVIDIIIGNGTTRSTLWTTDLSYDYIKINAEYRS